MKNLCLLATVVVSCSLLTSCFITPCSGCGRKHVHLEYSEPAPSRR